MQIRSNRFIAILLSTLLVLQLGFTTSIAHAAEEVITGIDFNVTAPVHMYIAQDTPQLRVMAAIQGSSTKKDVTTESYWISSDPTKIKVDKGLLTPLKPTEDVTITAKYKGFTITIDAEAEYLFDSLSLSEQEALTLELGDTVPPLTAAVEKDGTSNDVTTTAVWTSSNSAVVKVENGALTLVSKGKAEITAAYKGLSDKVEIEVISPFSSLTIDPAEDSVEMLVQQEPIQLQAIGELRDGSDETVTNLAQWTSSNENIVSVTKGKLSAKGYGTAKITVSYLGVSNEIQVLVRLPYQALTLSTVENPVALFLNGEPREIKASVANDASDKTDVTETAEWSSSNPLAVTVLKGVITPKSPGSAQITVKYRGLSKTFPVIVIPNITELSLSSTKMTLYKGELEALPRVTAVTVDEQSIDVTKIGAWVSSNENVVKIKDGKLEAIGNGTATVTVDVAGFTKTVEVTIADKVLALLPAVKTLSLVEGKEILLPVIKAVYENGNEAVLTNDAIVWKSSSPIVIVKSDGKLKASLAGKGSLTATYLNKTIQIPFTVEEEIKELTISTTSIQLLMNKTMPLKVTGKSSSGAVVNLSYKVQWSSGNQSIATLKGNTVRGVAEGTTTLTGTYQDKSITVTVKVVPKLIRLELEPSAVELGIGQETTLKLFEVYENGKRVQVTSGITWTSSSKTTATVTQGTIKGLKKGTTTIKAAYNKKFASVKVKVL